jgi:type VI secretion system protein ImpF
LFNNQTRPDGKILNEFSYVKQSVLNYGIKYVSGEWADTEETRHLIRAIEEAIVQFEPRILKETLSVHQSNSSHKRHKSKIHFEIEGELWAEPISEKLFIKTEFDLETGECRVT